MSKRKWTPNYFLDSIDNLIDRDDYTFSEYENISNCDSKFTIKCNKCNHIWQASCDNFFRAGTRCYVCNKGQRWSKERFLREVAAISDASNYSFFDFEKINKYNSKFKVKCKKCGHIWLATPDNFFRCGKRCSACRCGIQWSKDRVIKEFSLLEDRLNYTLLLNNKINGVFSVFDVKCKKCENVWHTNSMNFFHSKSRCPKCNFSKGEQRILRFLENNKVEVEFQKRFATCKNINTLPFDFYLPDYGIIIEFNGQHHYAPVCFGKNKNIDRSKEMFEKIQHRDAIKKQWVLSNGFFFIEIRYDEIDKIEDILINLLNIYYI